MGCFSVCLRQDGSVNQILQVENQVDSLVLQNNPSLCLGFIVAHNICIIVKQAAFAFV